MLLEATLQTSIYPGILLDFNDIFNKVDELSDCLCFSKSYIP